MHRTLPPSAAPLKYYGSREQRDEEKRGILICIRAFFLRGGHLGFQYDLYGS